MNRPGTSCVLVHGGHLPCPEIGRFVSSYVPAPGSDLPGAGYVRVGSSYENRSVTGCGPAPGSGLAPGRRGQRPKVANGTISIMRAILASRVRIR